jgi:TolA-binding protein
MRTRCLVVGVLGLAIATAVVVPALAQIQSVEEQARMRLNAGLSFLENRRFQEALKDFKAVVEQYPDSSVADVALLQIASYELDVAGNPAGAREAAESLLKKYAQSSSAPMAYVVLGRVAMAKGRTVDDTDTAIASFERVSMLFPRSDAVPAAVYYAGEALRLLDRNEDATSRYREVTGKYPRSIWSARAQIGMAMTLTRSGQPARAIEELQRVRVRFSDTREAAMAVGLNTILYRLYILPATNKPSYIYANKTVGGGPTGKIKNLVALAVGPSDGAAVACESSVSYYDKAGTLNRSLSASPVYGVSFGPDGRPIVAGKGSVRLDPDPPILLSTPKPDKTPRPLDEIRAAVVQTTGDLLVADADSKSVQRFGSSGRYIGPFVGTDASRLAINALDQTLILERDTKSVVLVDRGGKTLRKLINKGPGYEIKNPVDVSFDSFGHIYVLDRDSASVFVFKSNGNLVVSFSVPEKSPGTFRRARALALDSAGRLYIYDERTETVMIFQ